MSVDLISNSALGVVLTADDAKLADAEALEVIKDAHGPPAETLTQAASAQGLNDALTDFSSLIGHNPTFAALADKYGGPHTNAIFAKVDLDQKDPDIGGDGVSFEHGHWIYAIPRDEVLILRKGEQTINLDHAAPSHWDWIDWFGVC
jgi:hypothetical protein